VAEAQDASFAHGQDGLGDSGYPSSGRKVDGEHAVDALIRLVNASPGELTLVTLGPLTNLALATRLDPTLPDKVAHLVVMGGAIRGMGPMGGAEFNVYTDPEAAATVLNAWSELTLIALEPIMDHYLTAEQMETLITTDSPRAEFFRRISSGYVEIVHQMMGRQMMVWCDPLAVAVTLEPDIVLKAQKHHVQVELAGHHTRGHTMVDWFSRTGQEPNANIALEMDTERFLELLQAAVR
jgi:purine nucleosidase